MLVALHVLALSVVAATAVAAEPSLARAERNAMNVTRILGGSAGTGAHVRIRFGGNIEERLGRRGLKDAVVRVELRPASGRATVITDAAGSRRTRERRRGTKGDFDVVRDGRVILLVVEDLRAPPRRVAVTTVVPRDAGEADAAQADEFDKLLDDLPRLEEEGELREERADVREELDATEDALDGAEREADKTIDRIHRAQRDLTEAKSGARAREAREELEKQKKKLQELTDERRTLRAKIKLLRRWLAVLGEALRGVTVRQCNDGGDNGDPEDTLADHPADPGCVEPTDNDEKDVAMPLACPPQGGTTSPYAVINTPQSNAFQTFALRLASSGEQVMRASVTGTSGGPAPVPGDICGPGISVTAQYVVYTDGTPYSLPDPPRGDHAICVFIEAENPAGSGNAGGQDASLRLAAGTTRASTSASAAQTQRRDVASGTVNSPRFDWEAYAVPQFAQPQGSSLLVDILDSSGARRTGYGQHFSRSSLGSSGITASEYRPVTRPTRNAIVAGIVKSRARRVKVFFKDGQTRRARTVRPPSDWDIRAYRYFAVGATVARRHAGTRQVTARIEAYNASGDRIARTRRVTTF